MEDQPHQASGQRRPLLRRVPNRRMPTTAEDARKVPVTPGISFGTYDESPVDTRQRSGGTDYFTSSGQSSSSNLEFSTSETSLDGHGEQQNGNYDTGVPTFSTKGSVISATFTLPQLIQLDKNDTWVSKSRAFIGLHY